MLFGLAKLAVWLSSVPLPGRVIGGSVDVTVDGKCIT